MPSRPADTIRSLVTFAASADTPEARNARDMARTKIAALDTELLDTLASQRKGLAEDLHQEVRRLWRSDERASKQETGELVERAMLLLDHYERIDALIPAVMLLRIEAGKRLTDEERQQLDGPRESPLDQWFRAGREARAARRAERRAARKSE